MTIPFGPQISYFCVRSSNQLGVYAILNTNGRNPCAMQYDFHFNPAYLTPINNDACNQNSLLQSNKCAFLPNNPKDYPAADEVWFPSEEERALYDEEAAEQAWIDEHNLELNDGLWYTLIGPSGTSVSLPNGCCVSRYDFIVDSNTPSNTVFNFYHDNSLGFVSDADPIRSMYQVTSNAASFTWI